MTKFIRRVMEICPHCGALESAHTYAVKRDTFGNVVRYRQCKKCKKSLPPELLLRPENANP